MRALTRRQKIVALRASNARLQAEVAELRREIAARNSAFLGYHDNNMMLIQVAGKVNGEIGQCNYAFRRIDLDLMPDPRRMVAEMASRTALAVYERMKL